VISRYRTQAFFLPRHGINKLNHWWSTALDAPVYYPDRVPAEAADPLTNASSFKLWRRIKLMFRGERLIRDAPRFTLLSTIHSLQILLHAARLSIDSTDFIVIILLQPKHAKWSSMNRLVLRTTTEGVRPADNEWWLLNVMANTPWKLEQTQHITWCFLLSLLDKEYFYDP
jgi:hypothetical protein